MNQIKDHRTKTTWSTYDIKRLYELVRVSSYEDLSRILKKPISSIRWKVRQKGLKTKHPNSLTYPEMKRRFNFASEFGQKATMEKFNLTVDQVKALKARYKKINKQHMENIRPENLNKLRYRCMFYASKKNLSKEKAEDFGSYAVIKKIELGNVFITLENLYRNWVCLVDQKKESLNNEYNEDWGEQGELACLGSTEDFKVLIDHLDYTGRTILFLSLVQQMTFEDIAFCLNISKDMVGYWYHKNIKKLKKNEKIKTYVKGIS